MNRGYLLPSGCKDLIDVLNLKASQPSPKYLAHLIDISKLAPHFLMLMQQFTPQQLDHLLKAFKKFKPQFLKVDPKHTFPQPPASLPPMVGQIVIPAETTVSQLSVLLGQKPFQIIADIMELGFFVTADDALSFEIISTVARKHGFFAIRTA